MTRFLRIALVTTLSLSLVAATGCGSDTKDNNKYVEAINKAQTDFADSVSKLNSGSGGVEQTFKNLETAIHQVVADIKAVKPPDKVKNLHQDLVSELDQLEQEVKQAGDAITSKDVAKIKAVQATFAKDMTALQTKFLSTIAEINKELQG